MIRKFLNDIDWLNTNTNQSLSIFLALLLSLTTLITGGCVSSTRFSNAKSAQKTNYSTLDLHEIATFDVYVDSDVIHLITGGKASATDKQPKLNYTRSQDGGISWQKPIMLGHDTTSINSRGNDVQIAAKGNHLLVIWQSKGELPGMGPITSAYSEDNGLSWLKGANPAINNDGDQSHFDLIADQNGHFHAVWLEDPEENGYQSLRYARSENGGKQWNKASTLDNSTCSCCWNTFAISPENELNILYRDMKPRDMLLLQSSNAGNNWRPVNTVGKFNWQFDGCPHVGGSLAYSGTGTPQHLHSLIWTGAAGVSGLYHLNSNDNGKNWSQPKKLGNSAIHGDLAVSNETLYAVWDEMEAEGTSIFYATSGNKGALWTTSERLTTPDKLATHPRLVATSYGVLALWTEKPSKQPSHLAWRILK